MKVAKISNHDREDYSQEFVTLLGKDTFNGPVARELAVLCNAIVNDPQGPDYYLAVADDYVLQKREA